MATSNGVKAKTIKQGAMFPAAPKQIYKILMDSKLHSKFTGDIAKISKKVGGKFSSFSGYATGKNLILRPGKKIVQTWRASDWPKGATSEITFLLKKAKNGTKLMFTHKGVPAKFAKNIAGGWKTYYWRPLKKILEKKK
jgi:activator of HSP90 ATPase